VRDKLVFVFVNEKSIWGIKEEWITQSEKVRISDIEKTIVDALAPSRILWRHNRDCQRYMARLKKKIEYQKLLDYIRKHNKNVVAKRLGYILEIFDIKKPELINQLGEYVKDRYDKFDPNLSEKRMDKNKWRLIDNVGQEQILNVIKR